MSACLSVYRASVRPEIDVTHSTGDEDQNVCGVFSETAGCVDSALPVVYGIRAVGFTPRKTRMRTIRPRIALSCCAYRLLAKTE